MRQSNFTDEMKHKIILEQLHKNLTVKEICNQYNITPGTFYVWKRALSNSALSNPIDKTENSRKKIVNPEEENITLRRLYINLSAHNYELAKFLEKH